MATKHCRTCGRPHSVRKNTCSCGGKLCDNVQASSKINPRMSSRFLKKMQARQLTLAIANGSVKTSRT